MQKWLNQSMFGGTRGSTLHTGRVLTSPEAFRLPLIVRDAVDVKTLRAHGRAVRRLPAEGVKVAIDGLDPDQARKLQTRLRAYVQSCGCAEGGAAALLALLAVLTSIALRMRGRGPLWSDLGTAAAGLPLVVLLGGLGKLLGLTIARLRFERCCDEVVRTIDKS